VRLAQVPVSIATLDAVFTAELSGASSSAQPWPTPNQANDVARRGYKTVRPRGGGRGDRDHAR
jgi:hypothetical protein